MSAQRDWGFPKEYVAGMWAMLQAEAPDTFVLATQRTESVRQFVSLAFAAVDIPLVWEGTAENEVGKNAQTGAVLVRVNPQFYRPAEVDLLIGDCTHAKEVLGWVPQTTLEELTQIMVAADLKRVERGVSF